MGQWNDVCGVKELQPDSGVCALVQGKQVAIFYLLRDEKVYAIHNFDPIGKANVLSRGLIGDIQGVPVVASPLFKQHFSLITGDCLEDKTVRVEAYPARLEKNRVEICI